MSWTLYAFLSALFAGLTAVLAKIGVADIPSNLATLIRTCVIVVFALAIVFIRGEASQVTALTSRNWYFLTLSGCTTGLSWLCYFAALKSGPVSRVAPIDKLSFVIAIVLGVVFLHEKLSAFTVVGAGLVLAGVLLMLPSVQIELVKLFGR